MIEAEVKYKKTGIEWMPKVPEHWNIVRLKWVLRNGEGIKIGPFGSSLKLQDLDDNGIRVYGQENVIKDDFTLGKRFLSKEKFTELSVYEVFPMDILVTMMGTTGKCKLVPEDAEKGIIDSHLIRLRANEKMRPEFLSILINDSIQLKFQMSIDSKGSIMSGLNSKIVKNLFLPLPPVEEQNKIIDILDTESTKITRFIKSKQRFIELLKEQRQSIITNAVTKGTDDGVKMKETGIEWMPVMPAHWELYRLRKILKDGKEGIKIGPFGSSLKLEDLVDKGIRVYGQENVINNHFTVGKRFLTEAKFKELSVYEIFPNDILITMMGTMGRCKVVPPDVEKGIMDSHLIRIRIKEELYFPELLALLINESYFIRFQLEITSKGSIMSGLNSSIVKNLTIFVPSVTEQKQILEHIKTETRTLDIAISKAEREIELIKEYREAMIAEAVTGKMKL